MKAHKVLIFRLLMWLMCPIDKPLVLHEAFSTGYL